MRALVKTAFLLTFYSYTYETYLHHLGWFGLGGGVRLDRNPSKLLRAMQLGMNVVLFM